MSTVNVPNLGIFTVVNGTTVDYNGTRYNGVTSIQYPDGTIKTPAQIIAEAGGASYSANELRQCMKVELIDPDSNNRQVATIYSTNSHQVGKNATQEIPGGCWVEMFNFQGTKDNNYILKMWYDLLGAGYLGALSQQWIGFRINYGVSEAHSYILTYVNEFKEEGQPCPPSDIGVTHMHYAKLSGRFKPPATITAGGVVHKYAAISQFNLYRSNTASTGATNYQQVPVTPTSVSPNVVGGVFPVNATNANLQYGFEILDNVEADQLGITLSTLNHNPPTPRQVIGLRAWKNGIMVGFWKNTLLMCEPYRPSAWPAEYQTPLPVDIVALEVDAESLVVITKGDPYIFNGAHPAAVTYERLQNVQGGVAPPAINGFVDRARSVVKTSKGVIYLSREGPVAIAGGQAQPFGRALFTREAWKQAFPNLNQMRLAYGDGKLIVWSQKSQNIGAQLDLDDDPAFVYWNVFPFMWGAQVLPHDDSLYFLTSTSNGPPSELRRWNDEGSSHAASSYQTRDELLPKPENFGAIQVIGYGGTATIDIVGDGVVLETQVFDLTVGSSDTPAVLVRRLQSGQKHRRYRLNFTLSAECVVRETHLAGTPAEFAGV